MFTDDCTTMVLNYFIIFKYFFRKLAQYFSNVLKISSVASFLVKFLPSLSHNQQKYMNKEIKQKV